MLAVMDHLHVGKAIIGGIVKKGSVNAAVAGGDTLANRPDSRPTLAHVKVPVLLLVGMDDPIYAVELQKMMHRRQARLGSQPRSGSCLLVSVVPAHGAG